MSYLDKVKKSLNAIPEWARFVEGEVDFPREYARVANTLAIDLFYIGEIEKGRITSREYSKVCAERYQKHDLIVMKSVETHILN